jgi:flagellar hook-associated protein 3 FlgL
MKANPQFVVRGSDGKLYIDKNIKEHNKNPDSEGNPVNKPVTSESQIRMLTGVSDDYNSTTDTYSDGTSYFYIKGKKPNGESINAKFSLKNSDSVNDLLKKIGKIYGNTATSKVVDVSLNDMGEIQIKDI